MDNNDNDDDDDDDDFWPDAGDISSYTVTVGDFSTTIETCSLEEAAWLTMKEIIEKFGNPTVVNVSGSGGQKSFKVSFEITKLFKVEEA